MTTSAATLRDEILREQPSLAHCKVFAFPEDSNSHRIIPMETANATQLIKSNRVLSQVHMALLAGRLAEAETPSPDDGGFRLGRNTSSAKLSSSKSSPDADVRCHQEQDFWIRNDVCEASSEKTSRSFLQSKLTHSPSNSTPKLTMEIDSRDDPPALGPLHIVGALEDLPPATRLNKSLPTPVTPRKTKLTLSAFRRPEEAVRLTGCDATRLLENEYNLRAPGCGVIGHGAFSTVRLAIRNLDGQKVAVKSLSKFDALRARRLRRGGIVKDSKHLDEWEVMRLLESNPNVLTLFDVFETDEEIHLVTEHCEGGDLFAAIQRKGSKQSSFRRGRYSEGQAARITNQILRALLDLHGAGIVHRDIKPENILLLNDDESDIQVKLADFGMARLRSSDASVTDGESSPSTPGVVYGTNTPPEVRGNGACGPAADVFSLGVTLYILLCGFPPVFCDGSVEFPNAYWDEISDEAKSVVRGMVHSDPGSRITVRSALTHPWVRQQTTRVRRGSISANLELVRSRLHKAIGNTLPTTHKRRRRSLSTLSPKKQRRLSTQLTISMTDLYSVSENDNARVIQECLEQRCD